MLESVEKMRNYADTMRDAGSPATSRRINEYADKIECEVSEKFARIPTTDVGIPRMCAADAEANLKWVFDHEWENFDDIKERYMPLPLDADGMSWTRMDTEFIDPCGGRRVLEKIIFNVNSEFVKWELVGDGNVFVADKCRHVKTRTVEDVLNDFAYKVCDLDVDQDDVARYADELRDMFGGDA